MFFNDLNERVAILEKKVKALEDTLETLENMGISEQMEKYLRKKKQAMKMVNLINTVSDNPALDFAREEEAVSELSRKKNDLDEQIQAALKNAGVFSEEFPNDPRYFNYEVDSGEGNGRQGSSLGKGIRITSYNGFATKRVIVPREIDGKPVVSIGENVFMNTEIEEVILPKSVKSIGRGAFSGCKNLHQIDLPDSVETLGTDCFSGSGLESLAFPNALREIPSYCCRNCLQLKKVSFGNRIKKIEYCAFQGCKILRRISLPESLEEIDFRSFAATGITTMVFPGRVQQVSNEIFREEYRDETNITCVFLGKDTSLHQIMGSKTFYRVALIYCLPGSKIQQMAREYSIPIKPLSEFKMENHQ